MPPKERVTFAYINKVHRERLRLKKKKRILFCILTKISLYAIIVYEKRIVIQSISQNILKSHKKTRGRTLGFFVVSIMSVELPSFTSFCC